MVTAAGASIARIRSALFGNVVSMPSTWRTKLAVEPWSSRLPMAASSASNAQDATIPVLTSRSAIAVLLSREPGPRPQAGDRQRQQQPAAGSEEGEPVAGEEAARRRTVGM